MRNRHIPLSALVLLLAATVVAPADQAVAPADRVDDLIKAEMKTQNIPGLSLAVIKDGEIIKAEGYGLANIKLRVPARPETIYWIASVSKQFIATGIMLLVQEGQLGLDDPISKYLEGTPATWKGITIRHLLTHTSGLVREAPGFNPFKKQSDADVIKTAYGLPLRFRPGEKFEYSNVGYFALAEIIRKVCGRPWSEYLNEKVFKPSGMNTTYPTHTTANLPNRAMGYRDNDKLLEVREWTALRPSGAFLSTVLDMAKWDAVLYTDKVLSDSTRRQMWTPVTLNDGASYPYGFGWELGSYRGRKLVHHGGGGPGARAKFARFVDDRLTIIVLINLDDVDVESIVRVVAEFYLPATALTGASAPPPAKKLALTGTVTAIFPVKATPPSLRRWAVTVQVEKVKAGEYSQPEFTFTIHSPAHAGLAVGRRCTIEADWTRQEYIVDETRPIKCEGAGR